VVITLPAAELEYTLQLLSDVLKTTRLQFELFVHPYMQFVESRAVNELKAAMKEEMV
jgi:hypothetical protein